MKAATVMLAICCCMSAVTGQWIDTRIQLSDSVARLDSICSVQFHSPNHTIYVGGDSMLVAVDAGTHRTMARTTFPGALNMVCSSTAGNKLYCATSFRESVWVMDCATNQILTTVPLHGHAQAMGYAPGSNKVYVACPPDSVVDVIDCTTDSVVARIAVSSWPSALCCNPELSRICVSKLLSDEVAVIDCAADTVISTIWVRGVKPVAICYDSATNCVYTANYTSGTASVIDCASNSVIRVVGVDAKPERIMAGPEGKVYCGGYSDSAVTVVESLGARTIQVGRHLSSMSFDPVSNKVYCAAAGARVVVVDAIGDTVVARVRAGEDPRFVCYDPIDTSTWAASMNGAAIGVINGATDRITDRLWFRVFNPGALCYNPVNDRLYCVGQGLAEIDCDSNRVRRIILAGDSAHSIIWNPVNNKVYFSSPADNAVSILDCATDSITATVETGARPDAMCCSDDGKVYVTTKGRQNREVTRGNSKGRSFDVSTFYFTPGVAVIDPDGDSIRAFVPTPYNPRTLCYDRTDNKVYAGLEGVGRVSVIDADGDSIVATVPVADSCQQVCWNQNHDKVYVREYRGVAVIDCTGDTVMKNPDTGVRWWFCYADSTCDKVYLSTDTTLCIVNSATDTLYRGLGLWGVEHMLDNGRPDAANRLYCTDYNGRVTVISGATDSILRSVPVHGGTTSLAWNPAHSWVYVSNPGSYSITVVSDTMLGIEESQPRASSHKPQATVVRGVLRLSIDDCRMSNSELLDIGGRNVVELHAGANDVSGLAPGVYFVRALSRKLSAVSCSKVVITR